MSSTMINKAYGRVNMGTILNVDNVMREVLTNNEFTEFVAKNYEKLCGEVAKFGIDPEFSVDLVNDVWKSYKLDEENGNGYDMCKGNRDGVISIEQSVYGRIKRYSQNKRYQKATEAPRFNTSTNKFEMKEIACSYTSEGLDQLTGCQKAYAQMNSYDDLDEVEDRLALSENIQYILTFGSKLGMPVLSVVENLSYIKDNLHSIDKSIFKGFKDAGKEFVEAFSNVVKAASFDPDSFNEELAKAKGEFEGLRAMM